MWIGDILQDILVELLNGNWLSIISFTNYNCFSLFMAVLQDRHSSFLAAGELPARRPLSPPHQPMLLKGTGRNPLGMFPHCPAPWSLSPSPPSIPHLCPVSPGLGTWPGHLVREQFAVSGKHQDQEGNWDYQVILSFEMWWEWIPGTWCSLSFYGVKD